MAISPGSKNAPALVRRRAAASLMFENDVKCYTTRQRK
jgi:hypothetical protein